MTQQRTTNNDLHDKLDHLEIKVDTVIELLVGTLDKPDGGLVVMVNADNKRINKLEREVFDNTTWRKSITNKAIGFGVALSAFSGGAGAFIANIFKA